MFHNWKFILCSMYPAYHIVLKVCNCENFRCNIVTSLSLKYVHWFCYKIWSMLIKREASVWHILERDCRYCVLAWDFLISVQTTSINPCWNSLCQWYSFHHKMSSRIKIFIAGLSRIEGSFEECTVWWQQTSDAEWIRKRVLFRNWPSLSDGWR